MYLQKFVVLIVVLMMLGGLTIYVALDSELFSHETETITVNETSNTINK